MSAVRPSEGARFEAADTAGREEDGPASMSREGCLAALLERNPQNLAIVCQGFLFSRPEPAADWLARLAPLEALG